MIRSMTGFGRAAFRVGGSTFEVELRSVNHRYLDARVRLPRPMSALEPQIRGRIQDRFGRGKVDLSVALPRGDALPHQVEIDVEAAKQYLRVAAQLRESEGLEGELEVGSVLGLPGVACFVEAELPSEELERACCSAVDAAIDALAAMRAAEGAALERELLSRLSRVEDLAGALEQRAETVGESVRARLRKRAEQLERETGLLDEARLYQEIVIAADRMDVTEEIVRLRSHVEQFRSIVASGAPGEPVGRRLDFLLQELGREANTIGSKGSDAPIAHDVVELKAELERLREQVQNIE
jgi:uncharacterized protein (TIGR00255 family)